MVVFSWVNSHDLPCGAEELLPGFNEDIDAMISPALEKDHENCSGRD